MKYLMTCVTCGKEFEATKYEVEISNYPRV
jgi:DNA-directed RNA polymerase subunit RPC12/RpoP